jgi:hypothetical protein
MAGALLKAHDMTPYMDQIRKFLATAEQQAAEQADG